MGADPGAGPHGDLPQNKGLKCSNGKDCNVDVNYNVFMKLLT